VHPLSYLPFAAAAAAIVVALIAAVRAQGSHLKTLFVAGLGALAAESLFAGLAAHAATAGRAETWEAWRLAATALLPGCWIWFACGYGRGPASLSKRVVGGWVAVAAMPVALAGWWHDALVTATRSSAAGWRFHLHGPALAIHAAVLVAATVMLFALEQTFRRSAGALRWRVKLLLFGLGLVFAGRLLATTPMLIFREASPVEALVEAGALLAALVLITAGLRREPRLDVDVQFSPPGAQGALILGWTGLYLLGAGFSAQAANRLTSDTMLAASTLIALLALVLLGLLTYSERTRVRLRRFATRHFRRSAYDYPATWRRLARDSARCFEVNDVARALARQVAETLHALSVTVWLIDASQGTVQCAASTAAAEPAGRELPLPPAGVRELQSYFIAHPRAVPLDAASTGWAAALCAWPPAQFARGADRLAVPLIVRGQVLGLVTIADRAGGAPCGAAEYDLLECIADHAAAALLNAQLAQRLRESTQLEAFQTMAAFFVHDLKNAASTLSLMVQNLQVHCDDPAFRQDALSGLARTMQHMNRLIERLGRLRRAPELELEQRDLNDVVRRALERTPAVNGTMVRRFSDVLDVRVDAEQMETVVTNLVRNALEAAGPAGEVGVTTTPREGWAVLEIRDNGAGMTPEFIAHSLFRPFQTTKRYGLGIGMFQSRKIVEAHGGRIVVASEPGHGTRVEVRLPAVPTPAWSQPQTHPSAASHETAPAHR